MKLTDSMSTNKKIKNAASYVALSLLSFIWLLPIFWVVMTSFREETGSYTPYFFPKGFTINNYVRLLTETDQFHFTKWFTNTLFVAVCSCIISTFFVLAVSYVMSRMRFKMRKPLMNIAMILGMFPGFMSMIAVYYILKGIGITQSLAALIMVYSGGAGLGFYVAKGFFDTLPRALDESAYLDGCTKMQTFFKITLPMSKPIVVYTVLTSFMAPWMDYILPRLLISSDSKKTLAVGLYDLISSDANNQYTQFAAGAVVVAVPITILFVALQKHLIYGITAGSTKE